MAIMAIATGAIPIVVAVLTTTVVNVIAVLHNKIWTRDVVIKLS